MHQMVTYTFGFTYQFILYTLFFLCYFLMFSEFIFHRKSLRLPCDLRYHKGFVKFPMGLKVFFFADHVRRSYIRETGNNDPGNDNIL